MWQLRVQIKVQKENIRTKRETLEAHLEYCQTFKTKLFAKIINGFQPLFPLLSKLLYTDAYSEPSRTSKMELSLLAVNNFHKKLHLRCSMGSEYVSG